MGGSGDAEELDGDAGYFEFGFHLFALADVDGFVFVAVHEEKGRVVGGDVGDGRCFEVSAIFEVVFGLRQGTGHAEEELAVVAGEEVDWRGAGDYALDFGAFALYRVEVCGVAFAVEGAEQTYEVSAGGAAGGTDSIWADTVGLGVVSYEADGALDVFDWGGVAEAREGTVVDRKDSVAAGGESLGVLLRLAVGLDGRGAVGEGRCPAATGDIDDAVAVGLGGLVDVE